MRAWLVQVLLVGGCYAPALPMGGDGGGGGDDANGGPADANALDGAVVDGLPAPGCGAAQLGPLTTTFDAIPAWMVIYFDESRGPATASIVDQQLAFQVPAGVSYIEGHSGLMDQRGHRLFVEVSKMYTQSGTAEAMLELDSAADEVLVQIIAQADGDICYRVGGAACMAAMPYEPWLQMVIGATTVTLQTSPDGITWGRSYTTAVVGLDNAKVALVGNVWQTIAAPDELRFDNFFDCF